MVKKTVVIWWRTIGLNNVISSVIGPKRDKLSLEIDSRNEAAAREGWSGFALLQIDWLKLLHNGRSCTVRLDVLILCMARYSRYSAVFYF